MKRALDALVLALLIHLGSAADARLLTNGDFEEGLSGWATNHTWYEARIDGKGTGLSRWDVEEQVTHSGKRSVKIVGTGNRGIAMQVLHLPPAPYQVSGWLKCEDLGDATASLLIEFLDKEGKWFQGITAGSVSGTTDWTQVQKEVEFPPNAWWVHLDLLTSTPNNGVAWFDDIELTPVATGKSLPPVKLMSQPSNAGEISLKWEVSDGGGVAKFEVYVETKPFKSVAGLQPRAVSDWTGREATISVGQKATRMYAAVVPVSVDGRREKEIASVELTLKDTKPPRPVDVWVRNSVAKPNHLLVEWQPCLLEEDIKEFRLKVAGSPEGEFVRLGKGDRTRFPSHERRTWLSRAKLPSEARNLSITAVDSAGNESAPAWQSLPAPLHASIGSPDCDLWVASPLHNVFRDTPKPDEAKSVLDLLSARNETEGAQIVVNPQEPLRGVFVEPEPLVHENRKARIAASNVEWNFIGYLHVSKNSTATPAEELLRKAPDDFPDPFLEERSLDLKAEENQPIFVRVLVPKNAIPGMYLGAVHVVTSQGSLRVPIKLEVLPLTLPDQLPIYVTNWFATGSIAGFQHVTEWSEDFWRTIRLYAKEMHRGHQNVALTPLDLVKVYREEDGRLTFDYAAFDRWVNLFNKEGVAERIEMTHLGGRTTGDWECKTFGISPRPAIDRQTGQSLSIDIEQFLPDLQRHLEEKGWLGKTALHIGDEPIPVNVASWREQSERAHRAAPKLKRIDAIHVPPSEVAGNLEVLVPQLNYFEQWLSQFKDAQAKGSELWFYIAWVPQGKFTNRLIDYACIKTRLIHWINFLHGATGYLHWGLTFWTNEDLSDMGFAPGDNWIIYPGKWGPRSSLRWEAMRDGLEDFTYLHLLAKKSPDRAMELVKQILRSATDYDKDPGRLEQVRRQVARELGRHGG